MEDPADDGNAPDNLAGGNPPPRDPPLEPPPPQGPASSAGEKAFVWALTGLGAFVSLTFQQWLAVIGVSNFGLATFCAAAWVGGMILLFWLATWPKRGYKIAFTIGMLMFFVLITARQYERDELVRPRHAPIRELAPTPTPPVPTPTIVPSQEPARASPSADTIDAETKELLDAIEAKLEMPSGAPPAPTRTPAPPPALAQASIRVDCRSVAHADPGPPSLDYLQVTDPPRKAQFAILRTWKGGGQPAEIPRDGAASGEFYRCEFMNTGTAPMFEVTAAFDGTVLETGTSGQKLEGIRDIDVPFQIGELLPGKENSLVLYVLSGIPKVVMLWIPTSVTFRASKDSASQKIQLAKTRTSVPMLPFPASPRR